jgi:hypothetical protein
MHPSQNLKLFIFKEYKQQSYRKSHPNTHIQTMSAISIAEKKIKTVGPGPTVFAFMEFLTKRYEVTDPTNGILVSADDILKDSETEAFVKDLGKTIKPDTTRKKKITDEERLGQYDGDLCDARLWREKPKSGGLGYDNIQCSSKKADGCGCLCNKHFKMQESGTLWTGLITEDRPEEPTKSDGTRMFWSTDEDGGDVVKEKKTRKNSSGKKPKKPKKKSPEDMDVVELEKYMADLIIAKEKKEEEEAEEEVKKKEEEEAEEGVEAEEEVEEEAEEEVEEEAKEKENVSDMPKPHPDGAFAKKEKEEKEKKEKKKEEENGDDGWANDTEELSDGEDDEGYKEELNKEGQLVETAPPLDQVIGMDEEKEEEKEEEKKKPEKKEPKKKPEKKEPKKEEKKKPEKEEKKKKKFDITKFEPEPEKGYEQGEDLELDDEEESDDEEMLKLINIEGVEYQINFEDNTVISVDEFIHVGMWDPETESIEFDEED